MTSGHQVPHSIYLTKNMPQEAHDLVTQALRKLNVSKLESKIPFFKRTKQCHHMTSVRNNVEYYLRGLKSSFFEEMLKELQPMPPSVGSNED